MSEFESHPVLVKKKRGGGITGICVVMDEKQMSGQAEDDVRYVPKKNNNIITGKRRRRWETVAFSHLYRTGFAFVLICLLDSWYSAGMEEICPPGFFI